MCRRDRESVCVYLGVHSERVCEQEREEKENEIMRVC